MLYESYRRSNIKTMPVEIAQIQKQQIQPNKSEKNIFYMSPLDFQRKNHNPKQTSLQTKSFNFQE